MHAAASMAPDALRVKLESFKENSLRVCKQSFGALQLALA